MNCSFASAFFHWVDFLFTDIPEHHIKKAFADTSVILPKGIQPPQHRPDWTVDPNQNHQKLTMAYKPKTYTRLIPHLKCATALNQSPLHLPDELVHNGKRHPPDHQK